jgi:UDP-N-acetylglucosamine 2-epimerase (non-hydrolysing)
MSQSQRIMIFVGTRPEAIKMAPVIRLLSESKHEPVVVTTGQHREMLAHVVDLFALPVHERLDVMQHNQTLAGLTSRLLTACDEVIRKHAPALALVQGDTTTVLAASLACFYRGVPVGHVEAGLRTHDIGTPFPEEANRVLASRLARLHFAPTERAQRNLLAEAIDPARVWVTGNTVIDALQLEVARQTRDDVKQSLRGQLASIVGADLSERPYVVITGHRRENFGAGFANICTAIRTLAERFPQTLFVYPVHLNPNVNAPVRAVLSGRENIRLIEPQGYDSFVALLRDAQLILTDSGGVQEEAPSLGKPVLVMRSETERPEGIEAGTVRLVGTDVNEIISGVSLLLTDEQAYRSMAEAANPYGDGHAAERIVAIISSYLDAG